ncbi:MAG: iron-sulfur cluster assembly accessory protein [Terrimicrobiaceae bacterium]|nr:iron-sulfur cluster assembly accessory protein [Terrimicrobiaceae bacterium]
MIKVTDNAASALVELVRGKESAEGLRLAVEKGGCAGLQYAMTLGTPAAGDDVIEHLGARVFVDAESAGHLDGCTLDYEDGLSGAGFRILNPRAVRSCGCGTSFEPSASPHS